MRGSDEGFCMAKYCSKVFCVAVMYSGNAFL
jgi:hypothetical protein